jgi:hypothetical protein
VVPERKGLWFCPYNAAHWDLGSPDRLLGIDSA